MNGIGNPVCPDLRCIWHHLTKRVASSCLGCSLLFCRENLESDVCLRTTNINIGHTTIHFKIPTVREFCPRELMENMRRRAAFHKTHCFQSWLLERSESLQRTMQIMRINHRSGNCCKFLCRHSHCKPRGNKLCCRIPREELEASSVLASVDSEELNYYIVVVRTESRK